MNAASLRQYGLTPEDYDELLDQQEGRCAICRRKFTPSRRPQIDHDHKTGVVRGLLCSWDNQLLGLVRDNGTWLSQAASYLWSPPAVRYFAPARKHVNAPPERPE